MIPINKKQVATLKSSPRVGGGDPLHCVCTKQSLYVVPACAGVIPDEVLATIYEASSPRVCGGDPVYDPTCGFRVIIMTQANSQVNTRVLELLPKFKIKKMNCWCAV